MPRTRKRAGIQSLQNKSIKLPPLPSPLETLNQEDTAWLVSLYLDTYSVDGKPFFPEEKQAETKDKEGAKEQKDDKDCKNDKDCEDCEDGKDGKDCAEEEKKVLTPEQINSLGLLTLSLAPRLRTSHMLDLLQHVTRNNRFFCSTREEYGDEVIAEMLKYIYLEYVPQYEVVFEQDSIGYEFFIILQGQVAVMINLPNAYPEDERKRIRDLKDGPLPYTDKDGLLTNEKPPPRFKSSFKGVPKTPTVVNTTVLSKIDTSEGKTPVSAPIDWTKLGKRASGVRKRSSQFQIPSSIYLQFRKNIMKQVNSLSAGQSFGDAALLSDPSQGPSSKSFRNATIFALKPTFFCVLDKDRYSAIIGHFERQKYEDLLAFIKGISLFSVFSDQVIKTLLYFLEYKQYYYRDCVIKQGEKIEYVYIVVYGKIKVVYLKKSL